MDRYEPNPKHKAPWQPGRKGSLCPPDADGPALFAEATPDPSNAHLRWATDGTRFFAARSSRHPDAAGDTFWHGYPVDNRDIPFSVMRSWVAVGYVSRRMARRGGP